MEPIWTGYITKDQFFELDKFDDFTVWLGRLAPGTQIDLIIKKHEEKCSDAQRGYYFGVIVKIIAEHTGHEPEEIHDYLKWKFLRKKDDAGLEIARSTESLTTGEREQYHEKCRRWAFVVLDLTIPLPNQVYIGE
jgi:hypothetical protein